MAKKPVIEEAPVGQMPDELDLPPEAFAYFLLAQICSDKLSLRNAALKMEEYLQRRNDRERLRDGRAIQMFLARAGSAAGQLSALVMTEAKTRG